MFKYKFHIYKQAFKNSIPPINLWGVFFVYIAFFVNFYFSSDKLEEVAKALQAFISAMIFGSIWLPFITIFAFFKVKNIGIWNGNKFIFNQPQYVGTYNFIPSDNSKIKKISVKKAPANSLVKFKLDYNGGLGFIKLSNHQDTQMPGDRETQYSVRLNNKSEVFLEFCMPTESRDTNVIVNVISFEKDNDTILVIHNFQGSDLYVKK